MTTCSQNPVVTIRNLLISDAVIIRRQVPEKWENSVFQGQIRQEIQTNVGLIEEKSLDIQDLIRWNLHFPSPIWCAARMFLFKSNKEKFMDMKVIIFDN